jgi:ankyrin repeat protein
MVEILLAGNAAPLQQSNDGNTAFNFATQSGRHLVAYMIAEAAALHAIDGDNLDLLLDSIRLGAYVNIRNVAGWTPLMLSCARGNVDGVRELLSFGADPNRTENDGWTALHFAAAGGHDDIVELLLNNNADPHIRSVDGRLPREIALSAEHQTVADMLPQA